MEASSGSGAQSEARGGKITVAPKRLPARGPSGCGQK